MQPVQTSATAADGDFLLVIVRCLPSFIVMFNDTQVGLRAVVQGRGPGIALRCIARMRKPALFEARQMLRV